MPTCQKIDKGQLPKKPIFENAMMTPLAVTKDGIPAAFQLYVKDGVTVPPHATDSGTRIITVVSGKLFWGNGDVANPEEEIAYFPGDVLVIPAHAVHWLAAREGDILLQATFLSDSTLIPEVQQQVE